MQLSRRRFIQLGAFTGASFYLGLPRFNAFAAQAAADGEMPILNLEGAFASVKYNGDDVRRPHNILWDVEGYIRSKGGRPTTFRQEEVVVVGGGMSGLLSAYFLRDRKPVLLEQALQFGGNAKGERYQGSIFSIGTAYVTVPDEGSSIEAFFREIGVDKNWRFESQDETRVVFQGVKNLWGGETDPAALDSAKRVGDELKRIYDEAYPEIPWKEGDPLSLEALHAWDKKNAKDWLREVDPNIHPHVEEYFQLYCWSSFGASLEELSAAQFANFVAAETAGILALPGGNSAIACAVVEKLRAALPKGNLASNSIVLEVKNSESGVEVLYEDAAGELRLIRAKAAVMAAPKYVARAIVKGGGHDLEMLWKTINYRAYIVVNVLLDQKVPSAAYDLFCLEGVVPEPPRFSGKKRPWADLIFGSWASHDKDSRSVLTIYKPLPYEGAKSTIVDEGTHERIRLEAEKELPALLKDLGIDGNKVEGVRITRWGHALPVAEVGALANGMIDTLSAPIGKIFFANQDNYLNPAFESAFGAAEIAAAAVKNLRG
jgi:protoporphyrinogen oxidase